MQNLLQNDSNAFLNGVKGAKPLKNTPAFAVSESRRGHYFEVEEKCISSSYFILTASVDKVKQFFPGLPIIETEIAQNRRTGGQGYRRWG
jgi:hypothetical protein